MTHEGAVEEPEPDQAPPAETPTTTSAQGDGDDGSAPTKDE